MNRFGHFYGFDQLERQLVVDKYPSVSGSHKQLVVRHNGTVHLPSLDVQGLQDLGRLSPVDVDVVLSIVSQQERLANHTNMLDLDVLDPVDVGRCGIWLVQVLKGPNIL